MQPRHAPHMAPHSKHPMRVAGELFAWLWGPSEHERARLAAARHGNMVALGNGCQGAPAPRAVRSHTVERVVDGGRVVLRRTVIEEVEIRPH